MSEIIKGTAGVSLQFKLLDATTKEPKPAIDVTTLFLQYIRGSSASTKTSLTLLASVTANWHPFGAIEIDAIGSPGIYRVDVPDSAFSSGSREVSVTVTGTVIESSSRLIDLTDDIINGIIQPSNYKPTWPAVLPR